VLGASSVECDLASWEYSARCLAALAAADSDAPAGGTLTVCLIGPEVPEARHRTTVPLPLAHSSGPGQDEEGSSVESDSSSGQLRTKVYFHRGNFEGYQAFNFSRRVDAVFGFNLGLSCPDYSWGAALAALQDCAKAIARGGGPPLPLVCTASSRAESVQELLLLEQHGMLQIDKKQTRAIEEGEEEAGAGLEALKAARKDDVNEDGGEGHEDEDED
jgi:hypothetical protein